MMYLGLAVYFPSGMGVGAAVHMHLFTVALYLLNLAQFLSLPCSINQNADLFTL
jgi:hypothetical protein